MEVQGFLETGSENALSFANACIGNASNILGRNTPVRLRDCPINRAEQALWTSKSFDVDGIVVTMKHYKDFKFSIPTTESKKFNPSVSYIKETFET